MVKGFINTGYFLVVFLVCIIGYFLIVIVFQPLYHTPKWVIWGTFLFEAIVFVGITKGFPVILKIQDTRGVFYGAIWRFEFRREWIDEIIVDTGGFIFKPKPEYERKYRSVAKLTKGDWAGYRVVSFLNPKGLAAFIKIMRPITRDRINCGKMSDEKRRHWRELLYGEEIKRD